MCCFEESSGELVLTLSGSIYAKGKITDGKKTLVVASALDGNLYKNDVAFSVLKGKVSKDDIGSIFEEVA